MKLQSLLTIKSIPAMPVAIIVHQRRGIYYAQKVDYKPTILDLGVILAGYYSSSKKVQKLQELGNCLSVGHYLSTPAALKYGRDFRNNSQFKRLSDKKKKHLTQGIEDGTIAFQRDLNVKSKSFQDSDLKRLINSVPQAKFIYYRHDSRWLVLVHHQFRDLNAVINKILQKKTTTRSVLDKKPRLTLGKVCPRCHYLVPYHDHYCYHCGLDFEHHARCAAVDAGKNHFPTMKRTQICPHCHRKISATNYYCNQCGYNLLKAK